MNPQRVYDEDQSDAPNLHAMESGSGDSAAAKRYMRATANGAGNRSGFRVIQGGGETSSPIGNLRAVKNEEENPSSGQDIQDDVRDKLGLNYTGSGKKSKTLSNMYSSKSALKKRIAIAGAAAGGSIIAGSVAFFALLPLKITTLVNTLDSKAGASGNKAMDIAGRKMVNTYFAKYVLPGVLHGRCVSTADATCVGTITGDGPITKMYRGWSQAKLESTMASKYGIVVGNKNGQLYMNLDGQLGVASDSALREVINDPANHSLFNLTGTSTATRQDIQDAFDHALKDGTLRERVWTRYKIAKLMKYKYGTHYCIMYCDSKIAKSKGKILDSYLDRKLAAKAFFARNVVGTFNSSTGVLMQCIMAPGDCTDDLSPATRSDSERMSPAREKVRQAVADYTSKFGQPALDDLVKKAESINKDGFAKYAVRESVTKAASLMFQEATSQAAGEAAEKAIPIVGWVVLAAQITTLASEVGPLISHISYAANAAAAVQTFTSYQALSGEMQSGNIDPVVLGSFNDALSTNMDGSSSDQSDATQTPMYNAVMTSGNGVSGYASSIFGSTVSPNSGGGYKCNNGEPVAEGKLVCEEEQFNKGNNISNDISSVVNSVPVLPQVAGVITSIQNTVGGYIGTAFQATCNTAGWVVACPKVVAFVGDQLSSVFSWFTKYVVTAAFSDHQSGGRTFDMMTAGAGIIQSDACTSMLGCEQATPQQAAYDYNSYQNDQMRQFQDQPLFAKMFSTTTPYSLISRFSLDMPGTVPEASGNILSSLVLNPFLTMGQTISTAMNTQRASAAAFAISPFSAFGINQSYFPADKIPDDPDSYFQQNCMNGPMGTWDPATGREDVSDWMNAHQHMDPSTGEAVSDDVNPCLLFNSMAQNMGTMFDSSMTPNDFDDGTASGSDNQAVGGGFTGTIPKETDTATTIAEANQILNNPNITFQTTTDKAYFQSVAQTGMQTSCGSRVISSRLLGTLLQLSQKYQIVIGVVMDGHDCDGGQHPKGNAVDLNGINPLPGTASANLMGTGRFITWSSKEIPILSAFYADAGNLLAANGGGGLGQTECFQGSPVPKAAGVTYFPDGCNHLHMDVGVR